MKIKFKTIRRIIAILLVVVTALNQGSIFIILNSMIKPKKVQATTFTRDTQAQWAAGHFEYGEIDVNSTPNTLQKQLDLGTWNASGPANLNYNISTTPTSGLNTKMIKVGRFLYVFRNRGLGQFLRYDMDSREWKELKYDPVQPYEVLDATTNGTDTIWVFATRSGKKHFMAYDISTDTWSTLTSLSNTLNQGASLEYVPGTTNYIYAFRGGNTNFYRYKLNGTGSGQWSNVTNATMNSGTYSDMLYDGSTYLYVLSDYSNDYIYKYKISDGGISSYSINSNLTVNAGSDMLMYQNNIYFLKSGGNASLMKYNGSSLTTDSSLPFLTYNGSIADDTTPTSHEPDAPRFIVLADHGAMYYYYPITKTWSQPLTGPPLNSIYTGQSLTTDGSTAIYLFRGQGTGTFYKYTVGTGSWGSAITMSGSYTLGAAGTATSYNTNGLIYAMRGTSGTAFYSVDPSNGTTTSLSTTGLSTFGDGGAMVSSGSATLFAMRGANTQNFYKYTGGAWTSKANTPETVGRGGGIVKVGAHLYALMGTNRGGFYRYEETGNTWIELPKLPVGAYTGASMATDGTNYIYVMVGGENDVNGRQFYRFSVTGNSWQKMADTPQMMRSGGGLVYYNSTLYVYQGTGGGFYKYTPPAGGGRTYTTKVRSTWVSPVYDLNSINSLDSFSKSDNAPDGTSIEYWIRTSSNQYNWEDWVQITDSNINATVNRYLQLKIILVGDSGGTLTPSVTSFSIDYTPDTTGPDVSGITISGYSAKGSATTLTSGQTYSYYNPYFTWAAAATDPAGVEGYNVYFGTESSPTTGWAFQQDNQYVVTTGMTQGELYYLIVKAKDKLGNLSDPVTFEYNYNGVSPTSTQTLTTQADWDSPEATKSAVYAGSSSWWNQSYNYRRQLTVTASGNLPAGSLVKVNLDTASLETDVKLRADRADWRVAFWDGTYWRELDRDYVDTTTTYFVLQRGINASGSDTNYYVYYGNSGETSSPPTDLTSSKTNVRFSSGSLSFDGGDYVQLPAGYTTAFHNKSAITIEGFFKYNNTTGANRWFYGSTSASQTAVGVASGQNYLTYSVRTSATTYTFNGTTFLESGKWYHFALTYDAASGTANGYLNGRLDKTNTGMSGNIYATGTTQIIGGYNGAYMYGFLDEIRISSSVRYATSFSPPSAEFTTDGTTLGLYHMDDGSGQTLTDSSGNGYNGTLGSAAGSDANDPTWIYFTAASTGSEENVPVTPTNNSVTLESLSTGSPVGYQTGGTVPWGDRLQYGASVYANNALYVARGRATTTFYKFDFTTNIWSQLAEAPATLYYGSAMAYDGADAIYVLRGTATTDFYKYTISTNTWSSAISQPTVTFSYGAALVKGKAKTGEDVLYALRGGAQYEFLMYYLSGDNANSWASLATYLYPVYYGGGLAYDDSGTATVTDDVVWGVGGYTNSYFAKYSVEGEAWDSTATSPPQIPYPIGYMSNNLVLKDNYLYTFTTLDYQANNESKHFVWRYDKTNDRWETVNVATEFWAYTGAVAYDGSRYVYLIQGYDTTTNLGTTAMTRFDLNTYKFNPETPPLPLDRNYTFASTTNNDGTTVIHSPYTGTSLASDQADNVYFFQGGTSYINKYTVSTKRWTILPNLPCLYYGSAVHTGTDLYVVCGNNTQTLLKYDSINTKWIQMANSPAVINGAGNQIAVYDGTSAIYVLRGYNTTTVYKYNVSGGSANTWDTLANSLPAAVGTAGVNNSLGASMTTDGTYLYVARGNNTADFYRYPLSVGAWTTLTSIPSNVYYGSGSVYNNGKIYLMTGNNDSNLYTFDTSTLSWAIGDNIPTQVYAGGAMAKGLGSTAYILPGYYMFTFLKYNLPTATSSYKYHGVYSTKAINLGAPYAFAGLSATVASPSATSTVFETRTSTDSANWSAWTTATNLKEIDKSGDTATFSLLINSTMEKYIQVRTTMETEDSASTPSVSDITVEYYTDTTAPTNPDTLLAYETATKAAGQTLVDSQWYNKSAPYFEWTGASEVSGGSGIKGYWVYFGSDQTANATSSGTFTTSANYTASLATTGSADGEYYLRIQAEDNAGNYSSANWQPFHYRFDSQAPTSVGTVTADPRTYTYTNDFDMSWSAITDQTLNATSSGLLGYYYQATSSASVVGDTYTASTSATGITAYQEGSNTFRVKAKDSAGNETSYTNATFYYNATAPSAPTNLGVDTSQGGANIFAFSWDLPDTYKGSISEYRYSINEVPTDSNISTTSAKLITNQAGTQSGTNTFYVVAVDEAGNVDYDNYASIDFDVDITAPGIPLAPEAFDNSIRSTESYKVGLTWDKPTDMGSAFEEYRIYASTEDVECATSMSSYSLVGSTAGTSKGGSYVVTSMDNEDLESVDYYFCILACSSSNQCSGASTTVTMLPSGRWLEAPTMTASPSATVKTKSATIAWTTNRSANSFVKYGTASGTYGNEVGSSTQSTAHSVSLSNLAPGTTYYYLVKWVDEDGNEGTSSEYTFATNAAPAISNVKFTNVNISSAYVNFTIANAIKATINYGKTSSYGSTSSLTTSKSSTSYTVQIDGLTEGTTYHLKIDGEDDEGNKYSSDDYAFDTLPTPKISGLRLQQVVGMPTATLRLIWTTNTLASSIVTYYPTSSPSLAVDQISLALKKNHEVILKNLLDDTDYTLIIKGKDSIGNETKSETKTLKTATDIRAPEILNMNVESSVTGVGTEAKAQIIVTWDTDEQATTQVEYAQGTGANYGQTTQEDTNKTTNHSVTITGLVPAKIYHLRALSKDKVGNVGTSFDTVIITPKSTKDALNLVIDNLSKTFGFLNNLSVFK